MFLSFEVAFTTAFLGEQDDESLLSMGSGVRQVLESCLSHCPAGCPTEAA